MKRLTLGGIVLDRALAGGRGMLEANSHVMVEEVTSEQNVPLWELGELVFECHLHEIVSAERSLTYDSVSSDKRTLDSS